jgi:hypothetical protein
MLMDNHQKLMKRKTFITGSGTVYRIFEIHENYGKNESGEVPIIVKKEEEPKKKMGSRLL